MSDSHHHSGPPASKEALSAGHEVGDIHPKPIIGGLIGLVIFSAASFAIVVALFNYLAGDASRKSPRPSPMNADHAARQAPEPRLQTDAWGDWATYKMKQDELLEHYSWVDKESLLVRLPIDRAMEIVLERGLPQRQGLMPAPGATEPAHGTEGGGHR